jgi:hypothetical protein
MDGAVGRKDTGEGNYKTSREFDEKAELDAAEAEGQVGHQGVT